MIDFDAYFLLEKYLVRIFFVGERFVEHHLIPTWVRLFENGCLASLVQWRSCLNYCY